MNLMTTYTHYSEVHAITALTLISTLHKLLRTKSSPAYNVFNSRFLITDVNRGDSSAPRARILPSMFQ
jgi:hypothetical protein